MFRLPSRPQYCRATPTESLPFFGRPVSSTRQHCGQLGKRDNCQVAVTLSVATEAASLPIAYRLYLPEAWAGDPARRALADGVPPEVVVTDAGHGSGTDFRDGITARGLPYVAGILGTTGLRPPGAGPLPAAPWGGRGRPPTRLRRDGRHRPLAAARLAAALPADAWRTVAWREGTSGPLTSRFAAVRVRPATGPEAPPARPERHSALSVATLRRHLGVALTRRLTRCPCCPRAFEPPPASSNS